MLLVMNSAHWPSTVVSTARILLAVSKAKQTVCDRRRRYTGRGPPRNTTGTAAVSPTSGGVARSPVPGTANRHWGPFLPFFLPCFSRVNTLQFSSGTPGPCGDLPRGRRRAQTHVSFSALRHNERRGEACDGHPLTAGGVPQSWQTRRACTAAASASGALAEARHAPPRQTPVAAPSG